MGYFNDLKFGGSGAIGMFENSNLSLGALVDAIKGGWRTQGSFAPSKPLNDLMQATISKVNTNVNIGWTPTIIIKPITVETKDGGSKKYEPGFLPPAYLSKQIVDKNLGKGKINEYSWNEDNAWVGHLLNSHIESDWYKDFVKSFVSLNTSQKIDEKNTPKVESEPYSARDFYIRYNDQKTDYFRHQLHLDGYTDLKSGKNARESWDGSGDSFRLGSYPGTPYENSDPVIYGFEIIFDTFSSPLLNGSVEDFIEQFSYVSEIASKAIVIDDFKRQFAKIFRTKGSLDRSKREYTSDNILINKQRDGQSMQSNAEGLLFNIANADSQTNLYRPGKKAYLGYYLQKVAGLAKLSESNTSEVKKYLVDYGKDVITLSFLEDVSATMGALAHLYKLLYWSKPNGKNIIPENLLRFNCDIIVSECRNFSRVRKSTNTGDLEVIKDNVSRYIYQLRECQFYFNAMPHEDIIDMGNIKQSETFDVSFDYKYSATKFEKWVPAKVAPEAGKKPESFGKYVGYNNGAIWKIGNKGMRGSAFKDGQFIIDDKSVPKFYTIGTNTIKENGVTTPIIMDAYKISSVETDGAAAGKPITPASDETPSTTPAEKGSNSEVEGDEEAKGAKKEQRKAKLKEGLEKFKENSKNAAVNLAKSAERFVFSLIDSKINIRARLLQNALARAEMLAGSGVGINSEPKAVYPPPVDIKVPSIFFDIRNELFNFVGNEISASIGAANDSLLPGTQINFPYIKPDVGPTLAKILAKSSVYDSSSILIGLLKNIKDMKPFFDITKHSTLWAGKTIKKIYNSNTKFKYPLTTENTKYGGGFGVLALSFMKPKGTIYDGTDKPATMIWKYSKPLSNKQVIGTQDYSKIQFPSIYQKYPAPLIQSSLTLAQAWANNTNLFTNHGTNNTNQIQFPGIYQKYPAPLAQSNITLAQVWSNNTKLSVKYGTNNTSQIQFPNSPQKYPSPLTQSNIKLSQILYNNTILKSSPLAQPSITLAQAWANNTKLSAKYGTNNTSQIQFPNSPQKYPTPLTQISSSLNQIVIAGTKWDFPVNNKKFGK
jgi:hypothetical protein